MFEDIIHEESERKRYELIANLKLALISAVKDKNISLINKISKQLKQQTELISELKKKYQIDLVNEPDESGKTLLHHAVESGSKNIVTKVRFPGTKFLSDQWYILPQHLAAKLGHSEVLEVLIRKTVVDKIDEMGNTELHYAAQLGHTSCVLVLLEYGANPLTKNKGDKTPIELATKQEIIELLDCAQKPYAILDEATRCTRINKSRLENEVRWDKKDLKWQEFKSILSKAFENGSEEQKNLVRGQCQYFIAHNPSRNAPDQLIYNLIVMGIEEIIEFFIENGVDFTRSAYKEKGKGKLNIAKKYLGLYCAIEFSKVKIVEQLVRTDSRIMHYLNPSDQLPTQKFNSVFPDILIDKSSQRNPNFVSPLEYAIYLRKNIKKSKDETQLLDKIIDVLQKASLRFENIELQNKCKVFDPTKELRSSKEIFQATKKLNLETEHKPYCEMSKSKKFKKEEYTPQEGFVAEERLKKNSGILGEAYFFQRLIEKYKSKYSNVTEKPIANGVTLTGWYPAENKKNKQGELSIDVVWSNKNAYEKWSELRKKDENAEFLDPGYNHYDVEVKKSSERGEKTRYLEVKSTTGEIDSIVRITKKENRFIEQNAVNYRLYRICNLFWRPEVFKIKNIENVLESDDVNVEKILLEI